jgi:RNA methyltransferase, TrmH family
VITNVNSPEVKAVKRLAERSRRDQAGVFLVEGPQAVRELLTHAPDSAVDVFYTSAFAAKHGAIVALAERSPAVNEEVSEAVLEAMADTVTPQGVIAVAQIQRKTLTEIEGATLIAICHEVRDPGNAGTVIRAADAAGADLVILTGSSVDLHNPKLVRSSTGFDFPSADCRTRRPRRCH